MSASEKEFQAAVVEMAELFGWLGYHTYDSRRSDPGFPDLVFARARDGRVIFAEIKGPKTAVRPEQRAWLAVLSGCSGVETYLWRSGHTTMREIEACLR